MASRKRAASLRSSLSRCFQLLVMAAVLYPSSRSLQNRSSRVKFTRNRQAAAHRLMVLTKAGLGIAAASMSENSCLPSTFHLQCNRE